MHLSQRPSFTTTRYKQQPCYQQHTGIPGSRRQPNVAESPHPKSISKHIFIFGLGYTSIALGNWLAAAGWSVSGTCRQQARAQALRERKGWVVDRYDPATGAHLSPELQERLESSPYVLSSIPPLALGIYDPALAAQKALLLPLAAAGRIAWFGYLSSTGVYGDWQGEWVDESSPCRQTSSKAVVRQQAEAAWMEMYEQYGLPTHVFRLGGIYGPGRSVFDTLQAQPKDLSGSRQQRAQQRYTARCHLYDICAVLTASMAAPYPGRIYNVVDDDPAPRSDVMSYARTLVQPPAAQPKTVATAAASAETAPDVAAAAAGAAVAATAAVEEENVKGSTGSSSSSSQPPCSPHPSSSSQPYGSSSRHASAPLHPQPQSRHESCMLHADKQQQERHPPPPLDQTSSRPKSQLIRSSSSSTGAAAEGTLTTRAVQLPPPPTPPPPSQPQPMPQPQSQQLDEKRVANGRIRGELGVVLRYGSYREGLAAVAGGELWPLREGDLELL